MDVEERAHYDRRHGQRAKAKTGEEGKRGKGTSTYFPLSLFPSFPFPLFPVSPFICPARSKVSRKAPHFSSALPPAHHRASNSVCWTAVVEIALCSPVSQIEPSLGTTIQADAVATSLLGKWTAHFAVPTTEHSSHPTTDFVSNLKCLYWSQIRFWHR